MPLVLSVTVTSVNSTVIGGKRWTDAVVVGAYVTGSFCGWSEPVEPLLQNRPEIMRLPADMEAAGIEPASADAPVRASTSLGCPLISPAGRCAADLPSG